MFGSKIAPAALAVLVALGSTGAASADTGEHESAGEIAAVMAARTSVGQAIAAAERETGGRAVAIGVEKENGAYIYQVKTVIKDDLTEVLVDPASGKVERTDGEGLISRILDWRDERAFVKASQSPTTLAAAVAAAEGETGGKAIEAGLNDETGPVQFAVETAKDAIVRKVVVDSGNGTIVSVRTSDDDRHEDGEGDTK